MPYSGTCYGGPMDGQYLLLRRKDFIAVDKPASLYWIYRYDTENPSFNLDLTLTDEEIEAGLNADGTWDGSRFFDLQVQKTMWAAGLEVLAVPRPPEPPAVSVAEPEPDPAPAAEPGPGVGDGQ